MRLAIVIPCFDEQEVLHETTKRLTALVAKLVEKQKIDSTSQIYYVDDGSSDDTWQLIEEHSRKYSAISGIKLAKNVGHQNALLAGLLIAEGDALVSIDADLQDDINVIEEMIDKYRDGKEIVYGVRRQRDTDTALKRLTARAFYRALQMMGVDVIYDHADFRLLGRQAIEALRGFSEANLFLRGMVQLLGYDSSKVYYDRVERFAGTSKYSIPKMFALAADGVTSFSVVPLRVITAIGLLIFSVSIAMTVWVLSAAIFTNDTVPGWASTVLPIYFIGGVQLLCIGVLGEYVGKIYREVKRRPRYIVEKTTSEIQEPCQ